MWAEKRRTVPSAENRRNFAQNRRFVLPKDMQLKDGRGKKEESVV